MNYEKVRFLQPIEVGALYDDLILEFEGFSQAHEIAGWVLWAYAYIPRNYLEFIADRKVTSCGMTRQMMARTFTAHRIIVAESVARKYYDLGDNVARNDLDELDEVFVNDAVEQELGIGWWAPDRDEWSKRCSFPHPFLSAIDICDTYGVPISEVKNLYRTNIEPLFDNENE